jgi:HAMP domain-containing protein
VVRERQAADRSGDHSARSRPRLPRAVPHLRAYSGGLFIFLILLIFVLYVGFAARCRCRRPASSRRTFAAFGLTFGAIDLTFPLGEWLMAPVIESVSLTAQEQGIELRGRGLMFRSRLVAFALTLALAPTLYMSSISYMSDARAEQREMKRQARDRAGRGRDRQRDRGAGGRGWIFTFDAAGNINGRDAQRAFNEHPALSRAFEQASATAQAGTTLAPARGRGRVPHPGRAPIGVIIARVPSVSFGTTVAILLFLLIVALWAPLSSLFIANSTAVPVMRVSKALARVGEGEVSTAPKVPVFHQDEVGALARNYNVMLDQLRLLAQRANEVSKGALDIEFDARGDLGQAFRGQVMSLRDIVGHIAQSAAQLAGAASEMYAAAQEQEAAAQQQSVGVEEVSRTMESLLAGRHPRHRVDDGRPDARRAHARDHVAHGRADHRAVGARRAGSARSSR